ncbi:hypothetical protein EZ313_14900 [Ramlibacter henchirensis]|uniref:Uncharacterized protein n=1 Tax=Ramlibacter henchirensis TaxID=204072 RepID=A0A4Z0BTC8_9BURK|nr:hypothetical protein [Ramlibacter henchirensis]TFZ02546.1 hypothetical protein EZ313_14900 [Ramlibacter henchirensis]
MSEHQSTRFQLWADAQALAGAAEHRIATRAAQHVAHGAPAPLAAEVQATLILRSKATALLMAVLSESEAAAQSQDQENFGFAMVNPGPNGSPQGAA